MFVLQSYLLMFIIEQWVLIELLGFSFKKQSHTNMWFNKQVSYF